MTDLPNLFTTYLKVQGFKPVSIRSYRSDLNHFLGWLTLSIRDRNLSFFQDQFDLIKYYFRESYVTAYKQYLLDNDLPSSTVNRRLSTLRTLADFCLKQGLISVNPTQAINNIPVSPSASRGESDNTAIPSPQQNDILLDFKKALEKEGSTHNTIKNYLSDIREYVIYAKGQLNEKNMAKDFLQYLAVKGASKASLKRLESSLRKFYSWTNEKGEGGRVKGEEYLRAKGGGRSLSSSLRSSPFSLRPSLRSYRALPYFTYLNFLILVIFLAALGFGVYRQFIVQAPQNLAFPNAPVTPKRYLSFQGLLTNADETPITGATDVTFKLYDSAGTGVPPTGGNVLWNSGTCSIDPDGSGIFALILGTTSGDGYTCASSSEIASSVFSENNQVWMEITVISDTLSPRIQIATVAYALNAETLQGFPIASTTNATAEATMGATARTIPAINPAGNLVLASASPTLWSTSGTFAIKGQALSIVSEANGNITLAPNGSGLLNLTLSANTGNVINAADANLGTSGGKEANTLYYGSVANNNTNVNLLKLESGSSPTPKFTVDYAGNASMAGALNVLSTITANATDTINGLSISSASLTDAVNITMTGYLDMATAQWIGLSNSEGRFVFTDATPDEIDVQNANLDLNNNLILNIGDAGTDFTTGGGLTLTGYATSSSSLAVGYSSVLAGVGNAVFAGSVGIGTTNPSQKLDVAGNATISGTLALGPNTLAYAGTCDANAKGKQYFNGVTNIMYYCNGTSWITMGTSSTLTGSGTQNYIPKWNTASDLTDSILYDNGNIGIGTSVPLAKLDVAGTASFSGDLFFAEGTKLGPHNAGLLSLAYKSGVNSWTEALTVGITGNIGIGTTDPGAYKLNVQGKIYALTQGTAAGEVLTAGRTITAGDGLTGGGDLTADRTLSLTTPGTLTVSTTNSSTGSHTHAITSSSNPGAAASLLASAADGGLQLIRLGLGADPDTDNRLTIVDGGQIGQTNGPLVTFDDTNNYLEISGANIGIGTTAPSQKLDVSGNATISGTLALGPNAAAYAGTCDANAKGKQYYNGVTDIMYYCNGTSWITMGTSSSITGSGTANYIPKWNTSSDLTNSILYDTGTNVGIGTTAPLAKLDIAGTASFSGDLFFAENTKLGPHNAGLLSLAYKSGVNAWTEALTVGTTGNIGIGTTAPTKKLDVSGDGLFSGTIALNGASQDDARGINLSFLNESAASFGLYNTLDTNGYDVTGVRNAVTIDSTGGVYGYGTYNQVLASANSARGYGLYNDLDTSGSGYPEIYGVYNDLLVGGSSGGSEGWGVYTLAKTTNDANEQDAYGNKAELLTYANDYAYGLSVNNYGTGSTGGTQFGLYINLADADATRYGVYETGGATNYFAGNVGIGTTTPTALLDVAGTASVSALTIRGTSPGYINQVNGNSLIFRTSVGGDAGLTERMTITNAGNVGIGTTSPAGLLEISGSSAGGGVANLYLTNSATGTASNAVVQYFRTADTGGTLRTLGYMRAITTSAAASSVTGDIQFYTSNAGSLGHVMTLQSSGNVGIGTTGPTTQLEVKGSTGLRVSNGTSGWGVDITGQATGGLINVRNSAGTSVINIDAQTNANSFFNSGGNVGIGTTAPSTALEVVGTARARIFADQETPQYFLDPGSTTTSLAVYGNVGIGTTSPASKFEVYGTGNESITLSRDNTGNSGGTFFNFREKDNLGNWESQNMLTSYWISSTNTTEQSFFSLSQKVGGATTDVFTARNGNVGIGTTGPGALLDVVSSSDPTLRIKSTATNANTYLNFVSRLGGVDKTAQIYADWNGDLNLLPATNAIFLGTNAAIRNSGISYINGGNVGIGTTSPNAPLEVNKNIATSTTIARFIDPTMANADYEILSMGQAYAANTGYHFVYQHDSTEASRKLIIGTMESWNTTENLVMLGNGNIGIGTMTPGRTLDVVGNWGGNVVVDNRTLTTTQTVTESTKALAYHLTNSPASASTVTITFNITGLPDTDGTFAYIYTQAIYNPAEPGSSTVAIQINGTQVSSVNTTSGTVNEMYTIIRTNSTWHLAGGTSAANTADLAEWMLYKGAKPQPGQIVSISDTENTVEVSSSSYNPKAIGIVSTKPHTIMGQQTDDSVAIALAGQVPMVVSSTNGIIHNGDSLATSSLSGIGMKAVQPGQIIGKALETTASWNQQTCIPTQSIDSIIWPSDDGTNPSKPCFSLPDGTFVGKIMVFVNLSWYGDPPVYLTSTGDLNIIGTDDQSVSASAGQSFSLSDSAGQLIQRVGAFSEAVVANLRTGLIQSTQIITDTLSSTQINTDKLLSPVVETNEIGFKNDDLRFKNKNGETVMKIDENGQTTHFGDLLVQGKASVSGELTVSSLSDLGDLRVSGNATIGGTLYADEIVTKHGSFGDLLAKQITASTVSAQYITYIQQMTDDRRQTTENGIQNTENGSQSANLSSVISPQDQSSAFSLQSSETQTSALSLPDPSSVISPLPSSSSAILLSQAPTWTLTDPSANIKITSDVQILGRTSLADTSIAGQLMVDGSVVIDRLGISSLPASTLYLQPSGWGPLDLMAGKIVIDTEGNMQIAGTLAVKEIKPLPGENLTLSLERLNLPGGLTSQGSSYESGFGKLLVKGLNNETVASIDSEGNASFKKLTIASDYTATQSAVIAEINTNATSGIGLMPAGYTEFTIYNSKITNDTLIYVTPEGSTQNKVLYVSAKQAEDTTLNQKGFFKVAIDTAINTEIKFNWWLIN